jgi:dTDP-4-amino-4,6-dideoxygalactose transaminase
MIPFNSPPVVGTELEHLRAAVHSGRLSGAGEYTARCERWLEQALSRRVLLTSSCTSALEMAALALRIGPGDEVVMPSYTFSSTANAFALRGARIVFLDVRPDTLNIDEAQLESALTERTKAIVVVHYAGVGCEMDTIMDVAGRRGVAVVEDAAQAILASYRGRPLGTFGALGCFSFHETKGISAGGEGGALVVNDPALLSAAEVFREKGTNRAGFARGEVPRYTWQDLGSSYLMSELQAAYLYAQLEAADQIDRRRHQLWRTYQRRLYTLADAGHCTLPSMPPHVRHNAHMFSLTVADRAVRDELIDALKQAGVMAVFHYVPLHSSPAGRRFGRFHGTDRYTTERSQRLVRLPLFYNMTDVQQDQVIDAVVGFFAGR